MQFIPSIHDIAENYDAFIIDLWGVMHDGTALYPSAAEALSYLHEQHKPVVFLSNAPRKADKARLVLDRLGIDRAHYQSIITSGQVAFDTLQADPFLGTAYYYLGPGKDEDVLEGLDGYYQVDDASKADFVLNAGFEQDFQSETAIEPTLQTLLSHQLPLYCINPDLEVVKIDGTRMLCAGWVATRYAQLGGTVHYVGKPYRQVYETCLSILQFPPRVLCIGDNLLTDIRGANTMDLDSVLITGGILKSEQGQHPSEAHLATLCEETGATPTYVAELFQ